MSLIFPLMIIQKLKDGRLFRGHVNKEVFDFLHKDSNIEVIANRRVMIYWKDSGEPLVKDGYDFNGTWIPVDDYVEPSNKVWDFVFNHMIYPEQKKGTTFDIKLEPLDNNGGEEPEPHTQMIKTEITDWSETFDGIGKEAMIEAKIEVKPLEPLPWTDYVNVYLQVLDSTGSELAMDSSKLAYSEQFFKHGASGILTTKFIANKRNYELRAWVSTPNHAVISNVNTKTGEFSTGHDGIPTPPPDAPWKAGNLQSKLIGGAGILAALSLLGSAIKRR